MDTATRKSWPAVGYAATIFISAFLLFEIQPLVSKAILPWFGGSPAVWTTCLLFFQALLFGGYAYAHAVHTWLWPKQQAAVHLGILAAAVVFLRVLPSESWAADADRDPLWRILLILTVSVGLPYFALAATGPLLQAWFGRQFPGGAPYRLYAVSNLGSLVALVSYPFFFEWMFDLPQQARIWWWGFVLFAILGAVAAVHRWGTPSAFEARPTNPEMPARPSWPQRASWLAWPAFAVIVLMATTNHVSTDVAAIPFLWVVPLALYLITFIIVFDRPHWYRRTLVAALSLIAIYGSSLSHREGVGWLDLYDCGMTGRCARLITEAFSYDEQRSAGNAADSDGSPPHVGPRVYVGFVPFLAVNLAAMFGICLLCHGELARGRPHPRYLTSFYLMVAAGGALGGAAVALVAPHVFNTFLEWKLAMFVAAIATLGLILHALVNRSVQPVAGSSRAPLAVAPTLILIALLLPTALVLLDLVEYLHSPKKGIEYQSRNFFGTLTIRQRNPDDPQTHNRVLLHGATVHGSQFISPRRRAQPTTYYSTPSGIGRLFNYYRSKRPGGGLKIAASGLGTGTLAAYAGHGDSICFYEIDPAVVDIATSRKWFTYLRDAETRGARTEIKLGDARTTLESESKRGDMPRYDILVLDAFSGDAVPVHLLTAEAFELYLARLSAGATDREPGALVVHVSNRYLDLERVVRGVAERFAIPAAHIHSPRNAAQSINSADWIILSHNKALLRELAPYTRRLDSATKPAILWTDARSSLFDVIK